MAKKRRRSRSLEVTGRWPQGHLHVRSVQAEVVWQWTQATWCIVSASGRGDVSVGRGSMLTGRWVRPITPSGHVRSLFELENTSLETTGCPVDQRPVISICVSPELTRNRWKSTFDIWTGTRGRHRYAWTIATGRWGCVRSIPPTRPVAPWNAALRT
jgi:hypothetical protein